MTLNEKPMRVLTVTFQDLAVPGSEISESAQFVDRLEQLGVSMWSRVILAHGAQVTFAVPMGLESLAQVQCLVAEFADNA